MRIRRNYQNDENLPIVADVPTDLNDRQRLEHLIELEERERVRVASAIHDGFVQHVVGASMWLETVKGELRSDQATARDALETVSSSMLAALAEVRSMINDLRIVQDTDGFPGTVVNLVDVFRKRSEATIQLAMPSNTVQLDSATWITAARIVHEALRGAIGRTQVTEIHVTVAVEDNCLRLTVVDDGEPSVPTTGQPQGEGLGTEAGIRTRAEALAGTVNVRVDPGIGTTIEVRLPLPNGRGSED